MAITVKDAASIDRMVKTTDNVGVHTPHQNIDSLPALPAGTNNIGDVDVVSSVLPTGAATAALQTQPGVDIGDVTVNNAAGAGAVNIQDGGNSITIDATSLPLPTGAATAAGQLPDGHNVAVIGTATVQDTARLFDNTGFSDGGSLVIPAGFVFDEVAGTALTENDIAAARIDSKRAQVLVLEDATTRGQRAAVNASGQVSVVTTALLDGSNRTIVVGTVAHDSAVGSSSPVQVGVEARVADGTPVGAAGRLVRPIADTLGKQVVLQGAVHDRQVNGTANYTTTTAADVIAAQGAGVRIAVCSVLVVNAHATVGTKVEIRDGTTVKILALAAAAGGGFSLSAGGRPLFISTANTAVTARCVTTASDVDVNISGYTISN